MLRLNLNKKTIRTTGADGTKNVKIMVSSKYLINFWRTFEIPLFNDEINLMLTGSKNCIRSNAAANQDTEFAISDTKLYIPVVTSSALDNAKLLQQLKPGFKRTVNWNQYQSKVTTHVPLIFR